MLRVIRLSSEDEVKEIMYGMVERYFGLLKVLRDLEGIIAEAESKEEKIKAFKTYFKTSKTLKQLEPEVERYVNIL